MNTYCQKQPPRGVPRKRCAKNMQKIYRRTLMLCNFIEIALWHGSSPVNLLHIFRIPFRKNTSGRVLLTVMRAATKRNRFSKGISKKTYKYQRDLIAKKYKSSLPTHIWIKKIQNSDPPLTKPEKTHF